MDERHTMTTHFITAEIDLDTAQENLVQTIQAEVAKHGEPLRWAVTATDGKRASVEAVVTRKDAPQTASHQ